MRGSCGAWQVLPQAGPGPISAHSHMLIWALPPGHSPAPPQLPPPTLFPLFQASLAVLPSGFNHLPLLLSHPSWHGSPPPPPLSASSQLSRMNGTGSALAGQATRTAACPPSTRSCRPRSCPSRYWGTLHPPGDPSPQRGISAPPLTSPARPWSSRWEGPQLSQKGN